MATSAGVGSRKPAGATTRGAEAGGAAAQPPAGPRSRVLPGALAGPHVRRRRVAARGGAGSLPRQGGRVRCSGPRRYPRHSSPVVDAPPRRRCPLPRRHRASPPVLPVPPRAAPTPFPLSRASAARSALATLRRRGRGEASSQRTHIIFQMPVRLGPLDRMVVCPDVKIRPATLQPRRPPAQHQNQQLQDVAG